MTEFHGDCDTRFESVRIAFERNFEVNGEVGASVAVTVNGNPVVDLWGGFMDAGRTRPWEKDTIVNVYSTTKGMVALCAHILADRGLLDFEAPVARYWPEFAQAGKESLPVRYLLTHQAGLPVVDRDLPAGSTLKWDVMVEALAAQAPVWTPGEAMGYHAVSYGWLVGEVIRRISGKSVGTFLRDEVAGPLGVDFLIGFGPEEDHRVADILRPPQPAGVRQPSAAALRSDPGSLPYRAFAIAPPGHGAHANSRQYRAAEVPAGNGHGNARALARVYGALACGGEVDGVRLLSAEAVDRARAEQVSGKDRVLVMAPLVRRSLGFMLPAPESGDVRGPQAFGHAGMGGSLGYADPETGVGFGYTMNQMWTGGAKPDPRASNLAAAVNESLRR